MERVGPDDGELERDGMLDKEGIEEGALDSDGAFEIVGDMGPVVVGPGVPAGFAVVGRGLTAGFSVLGIGVVLVGPGTKVGKRVKKNVGTAV